MKKLLAILFFLAAPLFAINVIDGRFVTGMVRSSFENFSLVTTNGTYNTDYVFILTKTNGYPAGIYRRSGTNWILVNEFASTNIYHGLELSPYPINGTNFVVSTIVLQSNVSYLTNAIRMMYTNITSVTLKYYATTNFVKFKITDLSNALISGMDVATNNLHYVIGLDWLAATNKLHEVVTNDTRIQTSFVTNNLHSVTLGDLRTGTNNLHLVVTNDTRNQVTGATNNLKLMINNYISLTNQATKAYANQYATNSTIVTQSKNWISITNQANLESTKSLISLSNRAMTNLLQVNQKTNNLHLVITNDSRIQITGASNNLHQVTLSDLYYATNNLHTITTTEVDNKTNNLHSVVTNESQIQISYATNNLHSVVTNDSRTQVTGATNNLHLVVTNESRYQIAVATNNVIQIVSFDASANTNNLHLVVTNDSRNQITLATNAFRISVTNNYLSYPSTNSLIASKGYVTLVRQYLNPGLTTIPTISSSNGLVNISADGVADLYSTIDLTGPLNRYSFPELTEQTIASNIQYYIIAKHNGGSPTYEITDLAYLINGSSIIAVATVYWEKNNTINETYIIDFGNYGLATAGRSYSKDIRVNGYQRQSGLSISETGTRNINVTSGIVWYGTSDYSLNSIDTSTLTNGQINHYFKSNGSWTAIEEYQYDNLHYQEVSNRKEVQDLAYVINWIYRDVDENNLPHLFILNANSSSSNLSLSEAELAGIPAEVPDVISKNTILIGRIIVQKNSNFGLVSSYFETVFNASSVAKHNDLSEIQGGAPGDYYHLTQSEVNSIANMTNVVQEKIQIATNEFHVNTLNPITNNLHTVIDTEWKSGTNNLRLVINSIDIKTATNISHVVITTEVDSKTNNLHNVITTELDSKTNNVHSVTSTEWKSGTNNLRLVINSVDIKSSTNNLHLVVTNDSRAQNILATNQLHFVTTNEARNMDDRFPIDIYRFGFLNQTETSIWYNGENLFVLSNKGTSWSYYRSGLKWTIYSNKSITLTNAGKTNGNWYIYIDSTNGDLIASKTSAWTLLDTKVPIAEVSISNNFTPRYLLENERHQCLIDRRLHYLWHRTIGTRVVSQGTLFGLIASSTVNTNKTFGHTAMTIADEDLIFNHDALPDGNAVTNNYTILYRKGGSTWAWTNMPMPFFYRNASRIMYDLNGTMTTIGNGNYCNYYLVACNASGSQRFMIIPGRVNSGTIGGATGESFSSFDLTGIPVGELVAVWQITYQESGVLGPANLGECQYITSQRVNANIVTTSVSIPNNHSSLSGLQGGTTGEYYHLTSDNYTSIADGSLTNNLHAVISTEVDSKTNNMHSVILSEINDATNVFHEVITNWDYIQDSKFATNTTIRTYITNLVHLEGLSSTNYTILSTNNLHTVTITEINSKTNNLHSVVTTEIGNKTNNLRSVINSVDIKTATNNLHSVVSSMTNNLHIVTTSEINNKTNNLRLVINSIDIKTSTNNLHTVTITEINSKTNNLHSVVTTEIGNKTNNLRSVINSVDIKTATNTVHKATDYDITNNYAYVGIAHASGKTYSGGTGALNDAILSANKTLTSVTNFDGFIVVTNKKIGLGFHPRASSRSITLNGGTEIRSNLLIKGDIYLQTNDLSFRTITALGHTGLVLSGGINAANIELYSNQSYLDIVNKDVGCFLRSNDGSKEVIMWKTNYGRSLVPMWMEDKRIYLRPYSDTNHFIGYNSTSDGPEIRGYEGGRLTGMNGTKKTALTWNANGDVAVNRNLTASNRITSVANDSNIIIGKAQNNNTNQWIIQKQFGGDGVNELWFNYVKTNVVRSRIGFSDKWGRFYIGDTTCYFDNGQPGIAGPFMNMDGNDYWGYDRSANDYFFYVGGNQELGLDAAGLWLDTLPTTTGTANVIVGTGDTYLYRTTSSIRYKTNVQTLTITNEPFTNILKVRPVKFVGKQSWDSKVTNIGYLAEEIDKLKMKHLVVYNSSNKPESLNYDKFVVYAIEVIKKQQKEINDQKRDINKMKKDMKVIKKEIKNIRKMMINDEPSSIDNE